MRTLAIVCLIVISIILVGCNPFDEKTDQIIESATDRAIEIYYDTEQEGTIKYAITSRSDTDYELGSSFRLEYLDNEEWYVVPFKPRIVSKMVEIQLKKGDTREFETNLPNLFSNLPDGHYRIIKKVLVVSSYKLTGESFNIAFEFDYPFE